MNAFNKFNVSVFIDFSEKSYAKTAYFINIFMENGFPVLFKYDINRVFTNNLKTSEKLIAFNVNIVILQVNGIPSVYSVQINEYIIIKQLVSRNFACTGRDGRINMQSQLWFSFFLKTSDKKW